MLLVHLAIEGWEYEVVFNPRVRPGTVAICASMSRLELVRKMERSCSSQVLSTVERVGKSAKATFARRGVGRVGGRSDLLNGKASGNEDRCRQGNDGPRCCRCVVSKAQSLLSMCYAKDVAEIVWEGIYFILEAQ